MAYYSASIFIPINSSFTCQQYKIIHNIRYLWTVRVCFHEILLLYDNYMYHKQSQLCLDRINNHHVKNISVYFLSWTSFCSCCHHATWCWSESHWAAFFIFTANCLSGYRERCCPAQCNSNTEHLIYCNWKWIVERGVQCDKQYKISAIPNRWDHLGIMAVVTSTKKQHIRCWRGTMQWKIERYLYSVNFIPFVKQVLLAAFRPSTS